MKQWNRTQIMKGLQKMVPEITHLKTSEDFGLKRGGIWTIGEEGVAIRRQLTYVIWLCGILAMSKK